MIISSSQARNLDLKARTVLGIPAFALMENAGASVAAEAIRILRRRRRNVAIFCGKGNNGGDGFVAARHLLARGIKPVIFLAARVEQVRAEAKANLDILLRLKQHVYEVDEKSPLLVKKNISGGSLIIDALLGVGLSGPVKGIYADLVRLINDSQAYVLAVDVPSGLDATSGKILGCCVRADTTVTFMAKKQGMVKARGPAVCGRVIVKDIGLPLIA